MRKKAYAHPITDKGKGLLLQSLIESFLPKKGMSLRRGVRVRRFERGVSVECRGFRFSWTRGRLILTTDERTSCIDREDAFSIALKALKGTIEHYEIRRMSYELASA